MYDYSKRNVPLFISTTLFFLIVIICCLRNRESSPQINSLIVNSHENASTNQTSASNSEHIFHTGEMRGVWVPYFDLFDSTDTISEDDFKRNFDNIIQTAKDNGINTLFVHVRSHCDAVYPSEIFPYSYVFTDSSGRPPKYDPLEYMVKTAHKAGLEFHAWINPFRVISDTSKTELSENSPCYNWLNDNISENDRNVIICKGGIYLNPAKSEVRALIINGVRELVNNYNVDGVHLDDYFYMFTEPDYDAAEYAEYTESLENPENALPLLQWRCTNINMLISGIYAVVKTADDSILFGISPQGNMDNDLEIGADIYSWCSLYGYVDYIAPQIYFNSENPTLPFEECLEQWKSIIKNDRIKLYVGLALYKAGSNEDDGTWLNHSDIITKQIEYAALSGTDGYILYSWEYLNNEQTAQEMENYRKLLHY